MTWQYEKPDRFALHLEHDREFIPWMASRGINAFSYIRHERDSRLKIDEILPLLNQHGIASEYGGHVLQLLLPRDRFEANPEFFPVGADGKRNPRGNLCACNDAAIALVREGAIQYMRENPECALLHIWGADVWDELHPTAAQQRELYDWLRAHGEGVLTGDSFFHLAGYGESLPGLNLCGAGRVVCLIDPVGDVYACPFAIHDAFRAGNVRSASGFAGVWRESELFRSLREPQSGGVCASCSAYDSCRGGCMAAKFFTGLPLDGPDPECVKGYGELRLSAVEPGSAPRPSLDHSRPTATPDGSVPVTIGRRRPDRACDENPLAVAGF